MNSNVYYALGRPLSPLYSIAMRIREYLYQKDIFTRTAFNIPVISIGNLTMGGTGKTPLVQYTARLLRDNGYRPAVISRGYGGATKERINIVSDGENILLDAGYVGDEPRMLAETLPGVPVLTGIVRRLPAARAVEMGADILLLDDGFQHMAIRRDLDLVLFNADTLAGNSRVFPGGVLREPISALQRCSAFLLTGTDERNRQRAEQFSALLKDRFPGRPIFFSRYRPAGFLRREPGEAGGTAYKELPAGQRCFAFCGIARPEGFRQTLKRLGIEPVAFKAVRDHYTYPKKTVRQLVEEAHKAGANFFLCTEKDLVKLRHIDLELPLYSVVMEALPEGGFSNLILQKKRTYSA
ncbi:MAG: tetraacyldisaccharide 4'-kinase [Candidatus Electrothrix sp. YB6]